MNIEDEFPLVSIGMPVYNGADYIEKALASLLGQTYSNFELIISDNCSEDSSYEICQQASLRDSRIRLYRQPSNLGPLKNFEFVLGQAQGKYYMWAAHDDIWNKNWLSMAVTGFKDGVVMTTSKIIGINEVGDQISQPLKFEFSDWRILRLAKYFMIPESHGKANIIYSLFRTDIAKKYKFPGIEGFHGFDMHFVFFMLGKGSCAFIDGKALYKRVAGIQFRSCKIHNRAKFSEFAIRNFRYLCTYFTITESILDKLVILLLLPLKYLSVFWYGGQSVIRRHL